MRAVFTGCGLHITLTLEDKEEGNKNKKLECMLPQWKKAKVILNIVEKVKTQGFLEEPGFHIKAKPVHSSPEKRTEYMIYLSEERFKDLTNPEKDPVVDGGYFASRSIYDRIDITYFAV